MFNFNNSLITRVLVTVTLLLVIFFGVTSFALDQLFRESSRQAINDRLDVQILVLMAAAEEHGSRLQAANQLLDSRYLGPNSGLYGQMASQSGEVFWRSPSLLGDELEFVTHIKPGLRQFDERVMSSGTRVLALSVAIEWQFDDGHKQNVVYSVAESMEQYYQQLNGFRIRLFGGFAVISLLLIIAFAVFFPSVLKPLRRIENEINAIESGKLSELGDGYPRELMGVTENMNALLRSERQRMVRYRDTLGNLAHSLKTPLAVIRSLVSTQGLELAEMSRQMSEQVARMDQIVSYQLKRATASAAITLGVAPVNLREITQSINNALQKVYVDRHIAAEIHVSSGCEFIADKADLMELIGNLLDNAYKYCKENIQVKVDFLPITEARRQGIMIVVEDDGPGIKLEQFELVLARGMRLDERSMGQGIGLSVVRELVEIYRGSIELSESPLGGACVTVRLLGC